MVAFKRPAWVMVVLGLLGGLASLGPATISIVTDWQNSQSEGTRRVDALADDLAQDIAVTVEQGRALLPRLRTVLDGSLRPSPMALSGLLGPDGQGWVAVYPRVGAALAASSTAVPPHAPDRAVSFLRDGAVLVLLAEPLAADNRVMVVALPVPTLRSVVAYSLAVETVEGEVIHRDPGILSASANASMAEKLISRRPVPGQALRVVVEYESRLSMTPWAQRAMRTALAAVLTALVVVPILLLCAKRLVGDNQAAAALEEANRELSRSNADLEQFAYVASHDLKEPLRNIASYVQLLQRRYQGKLDEDADSFIGYTVDGVRRMQLIINELLAYSRIGTGPLAKSPVQTGALVSSVLGNLKAAIAEAGAVVEVVGPLPVVMGDAGQLTSVFQNLMANALKYRRDDVRPEVRVTVADMGGAWRFSITDNGIGIDPAYQQQIFELFKRLHGRDRYSGSGIGLAVCLRVIERHGGSIWVESVPGRGACFHFTLPKMG